MIITRPEIPVVLLIITSVTYSIAYAEENTSENSVGSVLRDTYNSNHPPSFQDYKPIPVAVVYEESIIPKGKSIVNERFEYNVVKEISTENTPEQMPPTEGVVVTKSSNPPPNLQLRQTLSKDRTLGDFDIPVAVVYDSETRKLRSNEEFKPSTIKPVGNRLLRNEYVKTVPKLIESITEAPLSGYTATDATFVTQEEDSLKYNTGRTIPNRERAHSFVPIIESESYVFSHRGNFHYSYEGGDGTKASERGELKTFDDDSVGEAVVGSFSYTDKDGNDFALSYTADENGYRPVGDHLPTPPPIPPAIARALKYLATKTPDLSNSATESY